MFRIFNKDRNKKSYKVHVTIYVNAKAVGEFDIISKAFTGSQAKHQVEESLKLKASRTYLLRK